MTHVKLSANLCGRYTNQLFLKKLDIKEVLNYFLMDINKITQKKYYVIIDRIYLGNEFCNNYLNFLTIDKIKRLLIEAMLLELKISFVIANTSESQLNKIKMLINFLCDFSIKNNIYNKFEIISNDIGVLYYINNKKIKINLGVGRLFNSIYRDPRLDLYHSEDIKNKEILLESPMTYCENKLLKDLNIKTIEFDSIQPIINYNNIINKYNVTFHFPWIYITSGRYCLLGSINKERSKKFKLYEECNLECNKYYFQLLNKEFNKKVYLFGNTVFYKELNIKFINTIIEKENIRKVYSKLV